MNLGELLSSPIIMFVIIGLISWFFNRNTNEEESGRPVAPKAPPAQTQEPKRQDVSPTINQRDEQIRRAIQEREQELKKKLSENPTVQKQAASLAKTIEEQYKKQKQKEMTEKPVFKEFEKQPTVPVLAEKPKVKELVKKRPKPQSRNLQRQILFDFKNTDIREVFVMTEIFGPPRSKRKQIR